MPPDVVWPVAGPVEIGLIADISGVFQVELEGSGKMLFEVEVK